MTQKRLKGSHKRAAAPADQDFRSILQGLAHSRSSIVSVFSDFCCMAACSLAMQTRDKEYLERAKLYSGEDLNQIATALGSLIL